MPCGKPLFCPSKQYITTAFYSFVGTAVKISHSSQELRENNIRGSFNGSDIVREFEGIGNVTENISRLFDIHAEVGFEGNLPRLVEATNNISPSGAKYTRLLHKSWHVIVTRTPTFRVANASQNSPSSIRPCHDCRPIASVAYPHQR